MFLKPIRKVVLVQEARSSWESQQDAEGYGETRSDISTVKMQDAGRQNNVRETSASGTSP